MKPDPMLPQKRQRIDSASKKNSGKNSKKKSAIKKKAKELSDDRHFWVEARELKIVSY